MPSLKKAAEVTAEMLEEVYVQILLQNELDNTKQESNLLQREIDSVTAELNTKINQTSGRGRVSQGTHTYQQTVRELIL